MEHLDTDRIDEYLSGRMDAQQRLAFEAELKENEALARELALQEDILQGIEYYGRTQFEENLDLVQESLEREGFFADDDEKALLEGMEYVGRQGFEQSVKEVEQQLSSEGYFERAENSEPEGTVKVRFLTGRRIILSLVASVLLLITVGWLIFRPTVEERLFADYFTPPADELSEEVVLELSEVGFAGNEKAFLQGLQAALADYQSSRFSEVTAALEDLLRQYPAASEASEARYYLAVSYLAVNRPDRAKPLLERLADEAPAGILADVQWYLALSYLQSEDKEKAIPLLENLGGRSKYQEPARSLLKRLNP